MDKESEKMDTSVIDEIVEKAASVAYARIKEESATDTEKETVQEKPVQPKPYVVAMKRRFLWPKKYTVIHHSEERFAAWPDGSLHPIEPRLILSFESGARLAIPNIEKISYSIYPL